MRLFIQHDPNQRNDAADISCTVEQLKSIPSATVTEIICENALDYQVDRLSAIQELVSKLRYGGRLIMTGVDVNETSRELLNGTISIDEALSLLYGGKRSADSALRMKSIFTELGLEVVNCRVNNLYYYILVRRNAKN